MAPAPRGHLAAAVLPLLVLLAATAALAAPPGPREFVFPERNGLYPGLQIALEPVPVGPIQVRLSSPAADLRISEHRIVLSPRPDGDHDVWATVQFSGAGTLVADLEWAGVATRETDRVLLPRQTLAQRATVRLARGPDGYRVTPLELPRQVQVQIRSRLAGDLAAWCAAIPLLDLTGGGCAELRAALSEATVPLPPPGETYRVPYAGFTPAERRALDEYLDEAAAARQRPE